MQDSFRGAFARWGMPNTLRLDNGYPWGHANDLPTPLALWLAGLGIKIHFNNPRSPRENGGVERSHGVTKGWAEPQTCADAGELQRRVDETDRIQREQYPADGKRSRLSLYPELAKANRPYDREWEQSGWDEGKARQYLSLHVARRRVDGNGKAWVYGKAYYIGAMHKGKEAVVQYDPEAGEWMFGGRDGSAWCRHRAGQINRAAICSLTVSAKPSRNHGKTSCPE